MPHLVHGFSIIALDKLWKILPFKGVPGFFQLAVTLILSHTHFSVLSDFRSALIRETSQLKSRMYNARAIASRPESASEVVRCLETEV